MSEPTPSAPRLSLERALRKQRHVRLLRSARFADDIEGFIVAVGAKWVLVATTENGGYVRGWTAVRIKHVDQVRRVKSFEETFARSEPGWPPTAPADVDLDTTAGALRTLQMHAGLIGIEQEDRLADTQWIGRIDELDGRRLWLLEVNQMGCWHEHPLGYRLRNITTIVIGSSYLKALEQVVSSG